MLNEERDRVARCFRAGRTAARKKKKMENCFLHKNLENALMLLGFAQASRELRRVKD